MKKILALSFLITINCIVVSNTHAADFGQALSLAIANVPPGADVAGMGNAWVATPEFSSNNPAVMTTDNNFHGGLQATYGRINFKTGLDINIYSGTVSGKLPVGVLQVTYSKADSGMGMADFGLDEGFNPGLKFNSVSSLEIQYGLKAGKDWLLDGDELYLGLSYEPVSKSKFSFFLQGRESVVFTSKGYSIGGGFLYKPAKDWNFGGSYTQSRSKDKQEYLLVEESEEYKSRTDTYRLGVGYQILPMTFLAADWQYLDIDGFKIDQLFAGLEQGIIKDFLYLYGGWASSGPTVGVGAYFENSGLNLAYMHRPFKDMEQYLGEANIYMATAYINF